MQPRRGVINNHPVYTASAPVGTISFNEAQVAYFQRIAKLELKNPVLVGFGISDNKAFETVCQYLNGGVVGSAFIRAQEAGEPATAFMERLKGVG